jgi:hypothetical protein
MMLITGPASGSPIPPRRLALGLTGPNDQRRDPTNKRQPNYQQKDHKRSSFPLPVEGPGVDPGLSCFEAQVLLAGTRLFTFQGKLMDEWRGAGNPRMKMKPQMDTDAHR